MFFINTSFSQQTSKKPNYKRIKKNIKKKNSNLYYYALFKKFNNTNRAMTLEEKRHLYFGYIFQKEYAPFGFNKYKDSLNLYARKKLTKKTITKMLFFIEYILSKKPFDLKVLKYQAYLYKKSKNNIGYATTKKKIMLVKDAILSTGNGRSSETAYHVIYRDHELDIFKLLKIKFNGTRKTIDKFRIERLYAKPNNQNIKGLFFNVKAFKLNLKSKKQLFIF